jgi:hypothetical protein
LGITGVACMIGDCPLLRGLKIRVSAVQFRLWAPFLHVVAHWRIACVCPSIFLCRWLDLAPEYGVPRCKACPCGPDRRVNDASAAKDCQQTFLQDQKVARSFPHSNRCPKLRPRSLWAAQLPVIIPMTIST